jgi:hypothetical protein
MLAIRKQERNRGIWVPLKFHVASRCPKSLPTANKEVTEGVGSDNIQKNIQTNLRPRLQGDLLITPDSAIPILITTGSQDI